MCHRLHAAGVRCAGCDRTLCDFCRIVVVEEVFCYECEEEETT